MLNTKTTQLPFDTISDLYTKISQSADETRIDSTINDALSAASHDAIVPGVQPETKTKIIYDNLSIYVEQYNNSKSVSDRKLVMPDIVDVHLYRSSDYAYDELRAVKVDFADGTSTKAVVSKEDATSFDLDMGLTICIAKRLLDNIVPGIGQSMLNKLVRRAKKVLNGKEIARSEMASAAEEVKKHAEKMAAKKRARQLKKAQAEREEKITIQKEAYVRAMKELYPDWMFKNFGDISTVCLNSRTSADDLK